MCAAAAPGRDDGWHSLLIRRTLDATPEMAYYLVFAPPDTSLHAKVTALGGRWRIEEDFANGKDLGLDHYEVRSFVGWYRHITLVMLALAFLVSIAAAARTWLRLLPQREPSADPPLLICGRCRFLRPAICSLVSCFLLPVRSDS